MFAVTRNDALGLTAARWRDVSDGKRWEQRVGAAPAWPQHFVGHSRKPLGTEYRTGRDAACGSNA